MNTTASPESFWTARLPVRRRRPALDGDTRADVAIVGGGLTGLWTAYYLKRAQPSLDVLIVEAEYTGFGGSGRNGGWLIADVAGNLNTYARARGHDGALRQQRAMLDTVDEVVRIIGEERLDVDLAHNGQMSFAVNEAQRRRMAEFHETATAWGRRTRLLTAAEARDRIDVAGTLGALFDPAAAALDPAKLVRGVAAVVEAMGVRIVESTRATGVMAGRVVTERGTVRARTVIRATESYTADIAGSHRQWMPLQTNMVVTEVLPDAVWDSIGWGARELFGDGAHSYVYAQRTADGRIAIGGRRVGYRFGSVVNRTGSVDAATRAELHDALVTLLPQTRGARVEQAWSGTTAVPRDWCSTVAYDPASGIGWAGGYVGHGLSTTNLSGRILTDLVLERRTPLTELPCVHHTARRWEPEPLRWIGVQAMYAAYRHSDRVEARGAHRTPLIGRVAERVSRRYV
ncbi:NAD(P)/FAD-dependent oxidoreductase [Streptomyces sp. NPDC055607]